MLAVIRDSSIIWSTAQVSSSAKPWPANSHSIAIGIGLTQLINASTKRMSSMPSILWISRISNISQCLVPDGLISLMFGMLARPTPPELLPTLALTAAPLTIPENSLRRRDTMNTKSGQTMRLHCSKALTKSHGTLPNTKNGRRCTMVPSGLTLLVAPVLSLAKPTKFKFYPQAQEPGGKILSMLLQHRLMTPRISQLAQETMLGTLTSKSMVLSESVMVAYTRTTLRLSLR